MNLSVIICSHNPRADFLQRTLQGLQDQTLSRNNWELLLVDNASEQPLAGRWDLSWHPHARILREDQLGLTRARLRGIKEASGEVLVFVDDDNVLDTKYLELVQHLMGVCPALGCIGAGKIVPEFEENPAEDLQPYTDMLALRCAEVARWSNDPNDASVPWGAGLVARTEVARSYDLAASSSIYRMMLDRRGSELNSCGDNEFSWAACAMGLGKGVFPELKVLHLIDRRRVQRDYLLKIAEGHAFSQSLLEWIHLGIKPHVAPPPRGRVVIAALLTGRASFFFSEANRWWIHKRASKTRSAFEAAQRRGRERALRQIQDAQHA